MLSNGMRGRWLLVLATALVTCTGAPPDIGIRSPLATGTSGAPTWSADWPQYLFNGQHTSLNAAATAITSTNVKDLQLAWSFDAPTAPDGQPPAQFFASPSVLDGTIYIGSNSGEFFAIGAADGILKWRQDLGWVPKGTCGERGITSTAAVVDGTVYVGGGDGKLYALDAQTGDIDWATIIVDPGQDANEGYVWGSPLVANGDVYIGISSQCDHPLIRGGIRAVDQTTGEIDATYYTVPKNFVGGSVWSSLAADAEGDLYASIGNPDVEEPEGPAWGDSFGLVSFAAPLEKTGSWSVPQNSVKIRDWDFGASPTIWTTKGTTYFGACNKDGTFYAVDAATHLLAWSTAISEPYPASNCLSAAVFDAGSQTLYIASGQWHKAAGTVVALAAQTGDVMWRMALPAQAIGSLSMNGAGLLAVPVYGDPSVAFVDAKTGTLWGTVDANQEDVFSQPVFSDAYLYVATVPGSIYAYTVGD